MDDSDKLSKQLKKIMSSGNLVSDKIINQIISNKLISKVCSTGYILDGYPRTISQSEYLLSFMKNNNIIIDLIFDFKIDFKIVKERIIHRSLKEKRSDDNLDSIKTRIDNYSKETYPVSQFFFFIFSQNYFTIDASQEVSHIQKELMKIIKKGEN